MHCSNSHQLKCVCYNSPLFFAETIRSFFAEKFWSLKHFGHLSHSCIKTSCNRFFSSYFYTFWPNWLKFFRSFQDHFGLWPEKRTDHSHMFAEELVAGDEMTAKTPNCFIESTEITDTGKNVIAYLSPLLTGLRLTTKQLSAVYFCKVRRCLLWLHVVCMLWLLTLSRFIRSLLTMKIFALCKRSRTFYLHRSPSVRALTQLFKIQKLNFLPSAAQFYWSSIATGL